MLDIYNGRIFQTPLTTNRKEKVVWNLICLTSFRHLHYSETNRVQKDLTDHE